jgi:hypothetical protein
MIATLPSFEHVVSMCDEVGMFEHADHSEPRVAAGYCTDDMARLLIAVCRQPEVDDTVLGLARMAYRFLAEAQGVDGRVRNRRSAGGRWRGRRAVDDCWGRTMWAFGTAAARAPRPWMRQGAASSFDRGLEQRSAWPRAMAFAGLGAAEVLAAVPRHVGARQLLADAVDIVGPPSDKAGWPWPEPRLTYANAAIPEVLIAGGLLLERPAVLDEGLALLGWLLARETVDAHLSPTGSSGAGPDDRAPMFDQQPIEVATMADACTRAFDVTADPKWFDGGTRCVAWFLGDNDIGVKMHDDRGGGYDGLEADGVNLNQGAESTLALMTTLQHGRIWATTS